MRPEWTALAGNVAAIPAFLSGEQPKDAIIDHFGFYVHCGGMLSLEVAVCGWNGGPGGERGTKNTCRVHVGNKRKDPDEPEPDPLTAAEVAEITALIEKAGLTVKEQWENPGEWVSWGCTFPTIHPTVKRARKNYSDGCPEHHTVFCNGWQNGPDNPGCTYVSDHREVAIPPAWVSIAWPTFEGGGSSQTDDDHGLEEVRRALAKITPLLVELGHHAATVNAGRKGHIEGEPGDLRFEPEQGHGVCLPAEAAEELVRLALIGYEVEG